MTSYLVVRFNAPFLRVNELFNHVFLLMLIKAFYFIQELIYINYFPVFFS
jgi:hypothetical protein